MAAANWCGGWGSWRGEGTGGIGLAMSRWADAASFVVMSELGIREALTLDRHFTVAGFITLPARR